jgi:RimJ/RimL family protein N-acetyltransferase
MIRTDRLVIRPWTASDLKDACTLWGDPEVMSLLGGPLSSDLVEQRLAREIASQTEHGIQYWKVHASDAFVGCCGLKYTNDPEFGSVTEMGFHLLPPHWGKGYATEASHAVAVHAFTDRRVSRLYAGHHPHNEASRGVLAKLGFEKIGMRFYAPTGLEHPWYVLTCRRLV